MSKVALPGATRKVVAVVCVPILQLPGRQRPRTGENSRPIPSSAVADARRHRRSYEEGISAVSEKDTTMPDVAGDWSIFADLFETSSVWVRTAVILTPSTLLLVLSAIFVSRSVRRESHMVGSVHMTLPPLGSTSETGDRLAPAMPRTGKELADELRMISRITGCPID